MAYLAFGTSLLSGWWLWAPVAVFIVLLFLHENVTRKWRRAVQATAFYRDGIARLDGAWKGRGRKGERFLDEKHPYAADLDLFGTGSLFELLCTAKTLPGEQTLANWLRTAAPAEEIERDKRRRPSCDRCSICAKTLPCSRRVCRPASISMRWRIGARPRPC